MRVAAAVPGPEGRPENLKALIEQEVTKRNTIEGDKATEAAARIRKAGAKLERARKKEVLP